MTDKFELRSKSDKVGGKREEFCEEKKNSVTSKLQYISNQFLNVITSRKKSRNLCMTDF